jgi:hypothetical protein
MGSEQTLPSPTAIGKGGGQRALPCAMGLGEESVRVDPDIDHFRREWPGAKNKLRRTSWPESLQGAETCASANIFDADLGPRIGLIILEVGRL